MLLPFTYGMDPATAMALLLGLGATTTTADPISAIVLGAPGHAASAATTLDGYPMTKRGEGGRALGAAYMSALIGGLFGAVLMAVGAADHAAADSLHRFAGTSRPCRVRHFDGRGVVRQYASARPDLRVFRHDARDDRLRPADRHAALDPG